MDLSRLFLIKEALASSQIEGVGTDLTVRDVLLAQLEREEREERAARRAARKATYCCGCLKSAVSECCECAPDPCNGKRG